MVTGGAVIYSEDPLATVQVYNSEGPKEQLPSLLTPRARHACAYYLDSQDRTVSIVYSYTYTIIHCTLLYCVAMFVLVILSS